MDSRKTKYLGLGLPLINADFVVVALIICTCLTRTAKVLAEAEPGRITSEEEDENEGESVRYAVEKHSCTYFYNARHPAPETGLINCTWYTSNACCKSSEVNSVFSAMDPLYSASVLCRNYINYLMCFFCSPDQYKFYKLNKKVMVCPDYCEGLYEECKSAGFNKTLIGEAYMNGTDFCEAQNFEVTDSADCFKFNPDVFGRSSVLFSSTSFLIGLVVIAFATCFSVK